MNGAALYRESLTVRREFIKLLPSANTANTLCPSWAASRRVFEKFLSPLHQHPATDDPVFISGWKNDNSPPQKCECLRKVQAQSPSQESLRPVFDPQND